MVVGLHRVTSWGRIGWEEKRERKKERYLQSWRKGKENWTCSTTRWASDCTKEKEKKTLERFVHNGKAVYAKLGEEWENRDGRGRPGGNNPQRLKKRGGTT